MKFDIKALLASALIGHAVNIKLINGSEYRNRVIRRIDSEWLWFRDPTSDVNIPVDQIEYVERAGGQYADLRAEVENVRAQFEKQLASKDKALTLVRRFAADLEALRETVDRLGAAELHAFLCSKSALGGDIKREPMDKVDAQLEEVCRSIPLPQAAFARALVAVARRDVEAAMKPYLDIMKDLPWKEFIRACAAKLAVIAMQIQNRENACGFIFWLDHLLKEDGAQVYSEPAIWVNYLKWCITFQHFAPLCSLLPQMEAQGGELKNQAYDALAYVFSMNENIPAACDALYWKQMTYGEMSVNGLAVRLIDDPMSYCMRYADRVNRLIEEGDTGDRTRGYIYDYVRSRKHCHVVNGMLCSYHLHETAVDASLVRDMKDSLAREGDYPADRVEIKLDSGGAVMNLSRY